MRSDKIHDSIMNSVDCQLENNKLGPYGEDDGRFDDYCEISRLLMKYIRDYGEEIY